MQSLALAHQGIAGRRFSSWIAIGLALVCVLGLAAQVAIVSQSLGGNPLAHVPVNDAQVYWQWAGEIADGKLVGATPFLSAPLYPYLLGLVRALGGGLGAVYVLQVALHVATALLLYRIATRRFSKTTGLLAALLYFLLADPAYYTARVLNCTLQAFVVAALWERALAFHALPRKSTALAVGGLLGLNVLANPTMELALPVFAVWTWWLAGRGSNGLTLASFVLGTSLAVIAPATLHNWIACGEFIPVSAQAGVTFYHGNAPGADGTYHAIPGISADRLRQNLDAREMVKTTTDGSWRATSKAFFDKGIAYWSAEPARAFGLGLRKIYWFVSGRNYGDIYVPVLEAEDGPASRLVLAPVPVAWWMLPALCLVLFSLREPRRNLPEILLFLLPLATVAIFWYSPRYRFPAIPIVCVFGAEVLVEVASTRTARRRRIALGSSLIVGIALGFVNRATGFDRAEDYRGQYEQALGTVLVQEGRLEEALARYQRALELGHPDARSSLGDILRRLGRSDEALELLRETARTQPNNAYAHRSLAVALAEANEFPEAKREFETALKIEPNDWESMSGLGNVLLKTGQADQAVKQYEAALRVYPGDYTARFNLGVAFSSSKRTVEAEAAFRATLKINPAFVPACDKLVEILVARGDHIGAIALLRRTLHSVPTDARLQNELAWELATAPETPQRNGMEALVIAQRLDREAHGSDPGILDTLAAAEAECERFEDAVHSAELCLDLARKAGAPAEVLRELEARLDLYRSGRAYRQ